MPGLWVPSNDTDYKDNFIDWEYISQEEEKEPL